MHDVIAPIRILNAFLHKLRHLRHFLLRLALFSTIVQVPQEVVEMISIGPVIMLILRSCSESRLLAGSIDTLFRLNRLIALPDDFIITELDLSLWAQHALLIGVLLLISNRQSCRYTHYLIGFEACDA